MAYENIGVGVTGIVTAAGAPVNGTNEVQTLTLGGTPTGGTFKINYEGAVSSAITWTATDATLVSRINTALDAMRTLGTAWVVATAGTVSSGIGTILLTFSGGDVAKKNVSLMTATSSLTGTSPTIAIATTTAGVDATRQGAPTGSIYVDATASSGKIYMNTGSAAAPTWTAQT